MMTDIIICRGYHEIVGMLLEHITTREGRRPQTVADGDGFTPIHAAIIGRSAPTLQVLLESGRSSHQRGLFSQPCQRRAAFYCLGGAQLSYLSFSQANCCYLSHDL
jgi:hypothetical protein